ncbi:hypothetical protein [Massilia pseudoviolaceinigra]|uniref:hypothetical protein n=1 Tax=Massilia pseudoviolaceinigra TaxID=3057165 RepID=UPI0027964226|nr:hypothetical protein [Massilia sp. CCM 9206]MDQ1924217.1 hypothetical protein [Massilia sp. CCM 9206]
MSRRCDSTEPDFCCPGWAPLSCRAGAPPKEPKPPNEPFFSALPASALLSCERCDHIEPDFCGGGEVSCERSDHDDPDFWGGGDEDRLPNEPNDEFFDDVDDLLLDGLDFWEENPLLYELDRELELELDAGFAPAVTVAAAGSSSASSNMI